MRQLPVLPLLLCAGALLAGSRPAGAKEKITVTLKEGPKQAAKPEKCEIAVFQETKPDKPYVDLGVINYHDERHRAADGALTLEVALPKMKAQACKAGGDALVDIRVTEVRRLEFAMFNVRASVVRFGEK